MGRNFLARSRCSRIPCGQPNRWRSWKFTNRNWPQNEYLLALREYLQAGQPRRLHRLFAYAERDCPMVTDERMGTQNNYGCIASPRRQGIGGSQFGKN